MNLTKNPLPLAEKSLSDCEQVLLSCQRAQDLQEAGRHEEARAALGEWWRQVGERPALEGLDARAQAEVLLRAGALSGFIGSSAQLEGAQEFAKNLISESIARFESLREAGKVAEAFRELSYCYWREGAYDEARVMLREALARLGGEEDDAQRALTLLRLAIVESSATHYHDALRLLADAAPLFERCANQAKRGTFHMERANVLQSLSADGGGEDCADRALVEYAAASFHFEQAGHTRYLARTQNNLGFLHFRAGRFAEAHEHLNRARQLFARLKDAGSIAQVDETRARALLAEGRVAESESAARAAVRALSTGGEQAILAEALTTHGAALARLRRREEAHAVLRRAAEIAAQSGDPEGAGTARLVALEELSSHLPPVEAREAYRAADSLLARTQDRELLARLRACARRLIGADDAAHGEGTGTVGAAEIESAVEEACARFGKRVRFTPAAAEAMLRLPLGADAARLRDLIGRTVERAEDGAVVEPSAVETVALRQRVEGVDFADPWANFSFREEVKSFEERLIEQALHDARGSVSRAARLLGFKHHESLNWRLKNRNKSLLQSRTPARTRRRSIIRKRDQ
jgi:tetratricopeptide (TPR) repeat protein